MGQEEQERQRQLAKAMRALPYGVWSPPCWLQTFTVVLLVGSQEHVGTKPQVGGGVRGAVSWSREPGWKLS